MHPDEIHIDVSLVHRLLAAQFPDWADLPIEPVESGGTNNAIYRLGHEMAVRLPRLERVMLQLEKEQEWLPRLAPDLPLAIPVPIARGEAAEGYPVAWSIYPWLEGENATLDRLTDPVAVARALAEFVSALQRIAPAGGPPPGEHNFWRGVPLSRRDAPTRAAIAESEGLVDIAAVTAAWEADLQAPAWDGPPAWIHGDLQPGNLLAVDGRLSGVIDWGGLGVGDPACDLLPAWNLLTAESRDAFREALDIDDATWTRGRGWALSVSMIGLRYYMETNPDFVRYARLMIDEVLADHERST
jgi:aminoglycoside phosphotransferase (APT) family kinase protein